MKSIKIGILALITMCLLTGCSLNTVDKLYRVPRRSQDFSALQSVMDSTMAGLEYCAPRSGENQQTVQMADLDGDGTEEYLVFAKSYTDNPLRILIYKQEERTFHLADTIENNGTAFDVVGFAQMDSSPGLELIVGCQVSDQVPGSASVYSFATGKAERMLLTNYSKMMTVDLDMDSFQELFILRPGQTETDNGIAELYGIVNGTMERTNEASMSRPVDKLKRFLIGQLHGGNPAVYIASSVEDSALITDVFAHLEGALVNVSFSNESGTSVQTMRNFFVYADDIDGDGVVELPALIVMQSIDSVKNPDRQNLIRWYAMMPDGTEVDKLFTYHDFIGGWYLELNPRWATRLTVQKIGGEYRFHLWSENYERSVNVFSIYALTGKDREVFPVSDNRFIIMKSDSVTYAAALEPQAEIYGITEDSLIRSFKLIQQEWKTGEM